MINLLIYLFNYYLIKFFSLDRNTILSNYPEKEQMSEFMLKCTSTAVESVLPNLFDWKLDNYWISEVANGNVNLKYLIEIILLIQIVYYFPFSSIGSNWSFSQI